MNRPTPENPSAPSTPRSKRAHGGRPIAKYMSLTPHSIGHDQNLETAHAMMRKHHIRHLPVLGGGKLVGLVSQRDLYLVETLGDVDAKTVAVEEAMTQEVYRVHPEADLRDVARAMNEHKYGCAVVMDGEHVVGIFTTVDAVRVLAEVLAEETATS